MVMWCDVPLKKQQKILKTDGMIKKTKNDGINVSQREKPGKKAQNGVCLKKT